MSKRNETETKQNETLKRILKRNETFELNLIDKSVGPQESGKRAAMQCVMSVGVGGARGAGWRGGLARGGGGGRGSTPAAELPASHPRPRSSHIAWLLAIQILADRQTCR